MVLVTIKDQQDRVHETSVDKKVQAQEKQIGAHQRRWEHNDVAFQQEDQERKQHTHANNEADPGHFLYEQWD